MSDLSQLIILLPALILSVIFHEYAHGRVAELLGDPTARNAGRLSLNPIVHIDPFGSIILPIMLISAGSPIIFGSAKPVPINPNYFENPKRGMMYVAIAGPLTNFTLAAASGFLSKLLTFPVLGTFLQYLVFVNIILGVFNLIPIPPLDGSRVLAGFLTGKPLRTYMSIERYGLFPLLFVLLFLRGILWSIMDPVISFFLHLFL
ncbi:MAG: site-2 protease family protein [Actinobacteria bacterium]|nr:site-2 protease family protein [Actinomycetota bacterium]